MKKLNGFFLVIFLLFSSFYFGTPALERYFQASSDSTQFVLKSFEDGHSMQSGETWFNKQQKRFKRPKYTSEKLLIASPDDKICSVTGLFFALILLSPVFLPISTGAHLRAPPVPARLA